MALSKLFAEGAVLTARDLNDHAVNHVPQAGDPYVTERIKLPNPGGWNNHEVHIQRVGLLVVLDIYTHRGTADQGSPVAYIPEGLRPAHPREDPLISNNQGSAVARLIVNTDGTTQVYGISSFGSTNTVRGSAVWVAVP